MSLPRRQFLEMLAAAPAGALFESCATRATLRWRGFNLQEKFTHRPDEWVHLDPEWGRNNEPFLETDFEQIARLGFNFVRLPMSYRCWTDPADPFRLQERVLRQIDQAVHWGRQYGIYVCLNFHRAPGYCINPQLSEPWNLWTDAKALEIFTWHWTHFTSRYKGTPATGLSFNLINEPNGCTLHQYAQVIRHAVQSIHAIDRTRPVMIDGMFGETMLPVPELAEMENAIHSTRGVRAVQPHSLPCPVGGHPEVNPHLAD
jgi:endoglucanase